MQPVLSVEQPRRTPSANGVGTHKPAFSLMIEGIASANEAARLETRDLLVAAARFAEARQFAALWPPARLFESAAEQPSPTTTLSSVANVTKHIEMRAAFTIAGGATPKTVGAPFWVEAVEGTEQFKQAAELGAYVLAHLVGRSVEAVGKDIALYRRTWKEAGHPGQGHVSLVVPTLVGEDESVIHAAALNAMQNRLRQQPSLMRDAVWDFPAFLDASDANGITPDEFVATRSTEQLDELITFAADRSLSTAGLIGSPEHCVAFVEQLKHIGVDEIACLVDFGWPTDLAHSQLTALDDLRLVFQESAPAIGAREAAPATNGHAKHSKARNETSARQSDRPTLSETEVKLASRASTMRCR